MQFLDREDELQLLDDHLRRPGPGLFVLYGRRRIGKTELIQKVLDAMPGAAYHVGTRSTAVEEMGRLSASLARAWSMPLLAAQPLISAAALMALLEGITGPRVLVLDELPYLVESDPALPGMMQAAWDRTLSRGQLKLLVCGSSVAMMESLMLSPKAPLFGRRTGQLRLGPLPPGCLDQAFPWPAATLVELAALLGGVPGYLQRLDPRQGLTENLRSRLLQRGEPLFEEVPFLLREELREPRVYQAILATVAAGARKFGEISAKVGLDRANLTRYMAILAELGLVEREVPVLEPRPDKSRRGLYRVADPFVASWFALVHPLRDALERGLVEEVWPQAEVLLARHLPLAVEPVVRELARRALAGRIPFPVVHAGRQWGGTYEYDTLLLDQPRAQAWVLEVKWTTRPQPASLLDELRGRVAADPALFGIRCSCAVISRAGFHGPVAEKDRPYLLGPGELLAAGAQPSQSATCDGSSTSTSSSSG